jgi:hypothetical protein
VHEILDQVGTLVQGFDPQRGQCWGTGAEGVDQLGVVLGCLQGGRQLGCCLVGGLGESFDQQTQPDGGFSLAQVQVRGKVAGEPTRAERGGIGAGRQQGFGQDFSGRLDEMHHL